MYNEHIFKKWPFKIFFFIKPESCETNLLIQVIQKSVTTFKIQQWTLIHVCFIAVAFDAVFKFITFQMCEEIPSRRV